MQWWTQSTGTGKAAASRIAEQCERVHPSELQPLYLDGGELKMMQAWYLQVMLVSTNRPGMTQANLYY